MRVWVVMALVLAGCGQGRDERDSDGDGVVGPRDCGPRDPDIHDGAYEYCDGRDNDCDGEVDEQYDLDADGFLADTPDCRALAGVVDCDDGRASVFPGAPELCNDVDDDCSGAIDDAPDADQDGVTACGDCDDSDPFRFPGAADVCDGIDNDCDGAADQQWDLDGDGVAGCAGDCDDHDPANAPGRVEVCDQRDNNCDAQADEGFDSDGDGYFACAGDCNDADATINIAAEEICDGVDTDCNGKIEDNLDEDLDGIDLCAGDCNDHDENRFPGQTETCNSRDDNCSGTVDELPECSGCTSSGAFELCTTAATFSGAELRCASFGMELVVPATLSEADDLEADALVSLSPAWWIGLSDRAAEGTFVWTDGSPLTFDDFADSQPANVTGVEDCVAVVAADEAWRALSCSTSLAFVCGP